MIRKSDFKPAWWIPGAHLQTMWPTFFRHIQLATQRERIDLPDGDFVDLDWVGKDDGPIVLLLHGLGGSIESPYAKGLLQAIHNRGWRGVLMHFRGCSGEPNRLARSYHSADTADVAYVVRALRARYSEVKFAAVGISMGGGVLLKWLGESGANNPLCAAVAVSVPFELHKAADRVNHGVSRIYQWWLLRSIRRALEVKFREMKCPVEIEDLTKLNNFWEFDNRITAPLHGFKDVHEYYNKASSRQYLKRIQVPTLVLHALDDPLTSMDTSVAEDELGQKLILEISDKGGHVGFIGGDVPWRPQYWLEQRIPEFLSQILSQNVI